MDKAPFGRTGHQSTRVIFGAAALGAMRQEKADQVLEVLLEYGINHIDTAASYGDSELRVGPWMEQHRDRFFPLEMPWIRLARDPEGMRPVLAVSSVHAVERGLLAGGPKGWNCS